MSTEFIHSQASQLQAQINSIKEKEDVDQNSRICVATKYADIEQTKALYDCSFRIFGENRLQEALKKQDALRHLTDIEWHFIGHIQSNKINKIVDNFHVIQSIDSLDKLRKINNYASRTNKAVTGFIQVNIGNDENKFGFSKEEVLSKHKEIFSFSNVRIQGIMIILPLVESSESKEQWFKESKKLFDQLKQDYQLSELSMGMSNDYKEAIRCGSTLLRIGRLLFKQ